MFLHWTAHEYYERDWHEYLVASAAVGPLRKQLTDADAKLHGERDALARAQERLANLPEELGEIELLHRGPAELKDSDHVVMSRRRLGHERRRSQLADEVRAHQQACDQLNALEQAARESLLVVFDVTRVRSSRLREYYERRRSVYMRAYMRVLLRKPLGAALTHLEIALVPPEWTASPCEWTYTGRDA